MAKKEDKKRAKKGDRQIPPNIYDERSTSGFFNNLYVGKDVSSFDLKKYFGKKMPEPE